MSDDHTLYANADSTLLLTIWDDGTHELATRPNPGSTWGPPVTLLRQSAEASS